MPLTALLDHPQRRRLAISVAAGVLAGALTAAVLIPASTPSVLDQARDARPTVAEAG